MNQHIAVTPTLHSTRQRRWARVFAVGALAAGAVIGMAGTAHAATAHAGTAHAAVASQATTSARGQTITYNEGTRGSCVFYALDRFHRKAGVYPMAFGDALMLGRSAAAHGWTVSATPRINSAAIFQPGDNGAGAGTGHAAWVERVTGRRIYISEMNAPRAGVVTHRWIDRPAASVRYIYAP
jgi:surface antigen